jgi:uncharacterized protein
MRKIPVLILSLLTCGATGAASFDCKKATTPTEKQICANEKVSELDEHLGRYYFAARAAVGHGASCLVKNQREWIARRNACKDAACLERLYLSRLAELDALQPGMTAIKNIELPVVKTLVWIEGPAEDMIAAPRTAKPSPLVVTGKIEDEVTDGDGFVIRDARGVKYALLTSMFITKASGVTFETLAGEADSVFEARGQREVSGDGTAHFAPGFCTFVYRMPK